MQSYLIAKAGTQCDPKCIDAVLRRWATVWPLYSTADALQEVALTTLPLRTRSRRGLSRVLLPTVWADDEDVVSYVANRHATGELNGDGNNADCGTDAGRREYAIVVGDSWGV